MMESFRKITEENVLHITGVHNYMLEFPTGFGKTKIGLELSKKLNPLNKKILVVVPVLSLINGWKKEIEKWKINENFEFTTYASLQNHTGTWNVVIFDECHHLSERCCEIINSDFTIFHSILLSATVPKQIRDRIYPVIQFQRFKVTTKEATIKEALPDPKVFAIKLKLNDSKSDQKIILRKSKGNPLEFSYEDRFKAFREKNHEVIIHCTQQEYYDYISQNITYAQNVYFSTKSEFQKNRWLMLCGNRLKWLSALKTEYVKKLLLKYDSQRTLTFCSSIKQTEELGKYCINSKNKISGEILDKFNAGEINHITACKALNEGVNLVKCNIGIFANLSSSEIIITQRIGRLLRVPDPILIIPYYEGTRDEEIVIKMNENFTNMTLI